MRPFSRFIGQVGLDARLWLFCMAVLGLARAVLVATFRGRMDPGLALPDFGAAFWRGAAYDAQVAALAVLPSFLCSAACGFIDARAAAQRVRRIAATAFFALTALLAGITLGYFREYNDQFNHYLFGLVEDDRAAIFATIWKQYHPVLTVAAVAVLTVLAAMLVRRLFPGAGRPASSAAGARWPVPLRAVAVFAVVLLLFVSARGSLERRPRQQKDMAVTRDEVLNRTVYNPYTALRYAIKDKLRLTRAAGLAEFLPDGDLRGALARITGRRAADLGVPDPTIDDWLRRSAKGPGTTPARHIFLLVLESYDAWPLEERWAPLGVAACGHRLAAGGFHWTAFLPDADGTIGSLNAIVTGLPDAGIATNYQPAARHAFPTAIASIFKRLGYRTRFFYAGFLSWQRIEDFVRDQGFEEVYGGPHMGAVAGGNEWGVFDEQLFSFVEKTVTDDRPSFNVVLTTSNHPPFNVDVYARGFPMRELPPAMAPSFDGRLDLRTLGHFWYQDREVCRMVDALEAKLPGTVVAMTGDHYSRRFPNDRPTLFESSAVPLILHGPQVLAGRTRPPLSAGSHVDMLPTLVELAAPRGFVYHAVGHDLLDPSSPRVGLGKERVIGPDFVADTSGPVRFGPLPGIAPPPAWPDAATLARLDRDQHAIAWWRVLRGASLPPQAVAK